MMDYLERLGIAIREARQHNGLKQCELAKVLHITPQHLRAIENGRQKPSYDLLCSLVHELSLPIDEVFHNETKHVLNQLDEVVSMLHYCNDQELTAISAALHAIMKFK
jgi:DNA-binding XRE family transcriptional regulator